MIIFIYSKINYFRQTNRNKTQFTSMLLEKMNKMNFYHLGGRLNIDEIDTEDEDRGKYKCSALFRSFKYLKQIEKKRCKIIYLW